MIGNSLRKIIRQRSYLLVAIGILLVTLITMGSAYLENTLSIVGNTKMEKNSWVIYFDDVEKAEDSVNAVREADIIDFKKTKIEFEVNLDQPGDLYEFTVWTVNDGTVDAMVDSIEKYELTDAQKEYLEFDVRYDTGEEIKHCDPLYHLGSDLGPNKRLIKAIVRFKDGVDLNKYPKENQTLRLFFNINYVQLDNICTPPETHNYHRLTIRPNGGIYEGRTAERRIYLEEGQTYTLKEPIKKLYNFEGWSVLFPTEGGTYTLEESEFTMGEEDVTLEAEWREGDYVARIMENYYTTIQAAFDDVSSKHWEDNTVWLLKDTTEYPTNESRDAFTFDLDGHTVTGTITNASIGNIALVNGKVVAEEDHDEAFINNGTLKLGIHDGTVEVENSIALIGNDVGLYNKKGSKFYFYDGYIEGVSGIVGGYTGKEEGYYVFVNHNNIRNCQKVYLVKNPNRAVVKTLTQGEMYYYNAQDGINSVSMNKSRDSELGDDDYILYAIRDFEAAYNIDVNENERIFLDLVNFEINFGEPIKNHGYFKIYNEGDITTTIKPSMTIENDGHLVINNVKVLMTTDFTGIRNSGTLDLKDTEVKAKDGYAVNNEGEGTIIFNNNTTLSADRNYGLYNSSPNLVIDAGNIIGLLNINNIGTVEITGTASFRPKSFQRNGTEYIIGVRNDGVMKQTGGEVTSTLGVAALYNKGTYTITDGRIHGTNLSVQQYYDYANGVLNVEGGDVSGDNTTIDHGTVNIRNNAEVSAENGYAISSVGLNLYSGKIYSTNNLTAIYGDINVYGGELIGGPNGAAQGIGSFYIEGGKVTSDTTGIATGNATIKGGLVDIYDTAITTSNLNISGGKVISRNQTGIVVSSSGLITGGEIIGDLYGVHSKGELNVGVDDGTIHSDTPVLQGGSYGLYIGGPITNFFDGIFKGQVDGYNEDTGRITGTPLGGTVGEGEETIDGDLYQTDFVVDYQKWLRVGEEEFNTINAASEACEEESDCTITVIKDAYTTYIQTFIDENNNKNITFDLNGHTISGTQTIINKSTVTIVDSSSAQTGTIEPDRVPQITNDNTLIIDGGKYIGSKASSAIYNRRGSMTIEKGYFYSTTNCIDNNAALIINDVLMEGTNVGINNYDYVSNYTTISSGTVLMNNGTIKNIATGIAAGGSGITIEDGLIESNQAIYGNYGNTTINGGKIHSKSGIGIRNYWGNITVNGGEVIADNGTAVQTSANTYINGGLVKGTIGVEHTIMCNGVYCWWNPINITGGKIYGTDTHGVIAHGSDLNITGGEMYGNVDGVQSLGSNNAYIGRNDGNISTSSPMIQGERYGYYTDHYTSYYTRFFDGIFKGKTAAHDGLIGLIPDSATIKDDYEYINRQEYKTQYLVTYADWLRVGENTYNSLTDAVRAVSDGGTIYVIADAYVSFEQGLPSGKEITLDLNGHKLTTTQPLVINGIDKIKDSGSNGTIHNLRDNAVVVNNKLTINSGNFITNTTNAISNNGTLIVNNINIKTYAGIYNSGSLEINDGYIEGTDDYSIYNTGSAVINGGTIHKTNGNTIRGHAGKLTVNDGTITTDSGSAIEAFNGSGGSLSVEINGGEITGTTCGIDYHAGGELRVNGGHISAINGTGILTNTNNAYLLGGTIEGTTYGVRTSGTTNIGTNDGTINIDQPIIKGDTYGLYIENGTLNFNDGILKGITNANYGQITNIPDRAQIFIDSEVINENTYETKYLITETDIAKNLNTGVIYSNLQDSLNEAQANETVQLLTNVPLYYSIVNNNQNAFTLDLNGYTISTNKPMSNTGNLTIKNTSENEAFIKTSTAMTLLSSSNTIYFDNVTLSNNSSDKYVLYNSGTMSFKDSKINSISGINNANTLNVNNSNIVTSGTSINNTGVLKVDGGTYQGSTSLYSNSNSNSEVKNATFKGSFTNNRGNLEVNNVIVNRNYEQGLSNSGYMHLNNSTVNGDGLFSNGGTMLIEDSEIITSGTYRWSSNISAISNSGNLTIKRSEVHMDEDTSPINEATIISNSGTLHVEDETELYVGLNETTGGKRFGIITSGSGNTVVDNSTIRVRGGTTSYGFYISDSNSHATVLTGDIKVIDATVSYGAYINLGKFTMGHNENTGVESEDVSQENPILYASGKNRGIGVKKVNGQFEFYDGILWGSRYAKPETTSLVEKNYEVTTYVDKDTGFEYAWLEWMGNDWQGKTVAYFHGTYYESLQDAIDVYDQAYENEEIKLLKSVSEDLRILGGNKAIINLNGHSVTGTVVNNGELQVFNGSLQNFGRTTEEEFKTVTVINGGTLIIGQDDAKVSSTNIRIVNEDIAIQNTGTVKMYDGYLEGNPSIDGEINEIAQYSRIHTVTETQYERKYLQSLSKESIENRLTSLILTIDPVGGFYKGNNKVQYEYLLFGDTYELVEPTKEEWSAKDFIRWEVSDSSAYDNGIITIGYQDLTATAVWEISPNAVARIGEDYYYSLSAALDRAKDGETITVLKDTEEDLSVKKEVTIDLGGHTVTGAMINSGILTLKNGTIQNLDGIGLVNLKTLTLGTLDEHVELDNVKIIGTTLGLQQEGRFNFYDGYIEGEVSMTGTTNTVPKGFSLYTEHNDEHNTQKLFLSGNPENAVASITDGAVTQFYFKLTDAIASARINGKEIKIEKDFEAAYEIKIKEDSNIVINMNSHSITTGNNIINDGTLLIYDNSEISGSITSAKSITNNGTMTIQGIKLHQNKSVDTLVNNGTLTVKDNVVDDVSYPAIIEATDKYAIVNNGTLTLQGNYELNSSSYALSQNGTLTHVNSGKIHGILWYKDTSLSDDVNINYTLSGRGGTLDLKDMTMSVPGEVCVYTYNSSNITINVDNVTMSCSQAIYTQGGSNNTVNIKDSNITTTSYGLHTTSSYTNLTATNTNVTSNNHAVLIESPNNTFNLDGEYKNTNGVAIYCWYHNSATTNSIYLNGGLVQGTSHAIQARCAYIEVGDAEVRTTSTNRDHYAIYMEGYSSIYLKDGAFINGPKASGIRLWSGLYMEEGSRIYSGASNGYAIWSGWIQGTMRGGSIEAPGKSSYAIYTSNDYCDFTLQGGTITSGNVGIYLNDTNTSNNYKKQLQIYGGTVQGDTYGIYMNQIHTVTIGDIEAEDNTNVPSVSGGNYGIYRNNGTIKFYNGKLRGLINGYNNVINEIKVDKEITSTIEYSHDQDDIKTLTTINYSSDPISKYAKVGNGYARITYIDETEGSCVKGTVKEIPYTGDEEEFIVTCEGKYKLEVWGAQGGGTYGGKGGYSTGEIDLSIGERLYINVGGTTSNGTGGYNGGGTNAQRPYGGGGATHIATSPGLLKDLEDDKSSVLIVAGGGGGEGQSSQAGGSGGGHIGNNGVGDAPGAGATQEAGGQTQNNCCTGLTHGTFGKGGQCYWSGEYLGAGGGGWYGGASGTGAGNNGSGGGGSGYISNPRLTNKVMYGYNVTATKSEYVTNFLIDRDQFLQVGENTYNSFAAADAAIAEGSTATVVLLKDTMNSVASSFSANKTITFDLNGHTLQSTKRLSNNANLTIIDSSDEKTGKMEAFLDDTIDNTGNLTLDGITIDHKDPATSAIYLKSGSGNAIIKNCTITSVSNGVWSNSSQKVTFNNNTMSVGGVGIRFNTSDSSLDTTGSTITTKDMGIHVNQSHRNKITIHSINLTTTNNRAMYIYGENNEVTIEDGTIISTSSHGIEMPSYGSVHNTFTMKKGLIKGADYGAIFHSTYAYLNGGEITTTSTSRDRYAIHHEYYSYVELNNDVKITAPSASGIFSNDGFKMNGGTITAGNVSAFGIYDYAGNSTINGGTITTTGSTSYGIYYGNSSGTYTMNFNGGEVTSNNVGVYMSQGTRTFNMNAGKITATNMTVYQNTAGSTFNIGKEADDLSITDPLLVSDNIVVGRNRGTTNYYNGKLTSKSIISNNRFNALRKDMQIKYSYDYIDNALVSLSLSNTSEEPIADTPKEGNGYAKITYVEKQDNSAIPEYTEIDEITNSTVIDTFILDSKEYGYKAEAQEYTATYTGDYKIELWGGSGDSGAYGAYTSGYLHLEEGEKIYFYVGTTSSGGGNKKVFNNGTGNDGGWNGGGATDVRLTSGAWDSFNSLKSRIMVAGAGGSGGTTGAGGGLIGYSGNGTAGGTQTDPGSAQVNRYTTSKFGIANGGCSGGNGYYPGGGATCNSGAGGGSSYISGFQGCDSIAEYSTESAIVHTGNSTHYSGKVFTDSVMIDGKGYEWVNGEKGDLVKMPTFDGTSTMVGNSGAGHAKITIATVNNEASVRFINEFNNTDKEVLYTIGSALGDGPVANISGLRFVGWYLDKAYTKKVLPTTIVNVNTYLYALYEPEDNYCDSILNTTFEYEYTGEEEILIAACKGKYKLEVWGAQGGYAYNEANRGGPGGYSRGYITLNTNEKLYINVGQQGHSNSSSISPKVYNGGGKGDTADSGLYAGSGGGATHIATKSGQLSTLSNNKDSIIIVAGGGGGASYHGDRSTTQGAGGGGIKGADGTSQEWTGGKGGTQTAGGARASSGSEDGSFGKGGHGQANAGGGGGAGWYGGGGGNGGSGGGGSGYVGNTRLSDVIMTGYQTPGAGYTAIHATLEDKTGYLEVNGTVYNSFEKAIAAITTEGTIKLLSNVDITEVVTIPETKAVTLDLNGKILGLSKTMVNNGTLTITDSTDTIGTIKNVNGNAINTTNTLTVVKANITSSNIAIYSSTGEGIITTKKDVFLKGTSGIYTEGKNTINVDGTNFEVTSYGIRSNGRYSTINISDATIKSSGEGIRLQNHNQSLTIENIDLLSNSYGVYTYGEENTFTMNDGVIQSKTTYALINDSSYNTSRLQTMTLNGGKLIGGGHGCHIYYARFYVNKGEVTTTSTNRDHYAIYSAGYGSVFLEKDAYVNAPNASGIRTGSGLTINGGTIHTGAKNGYGVYSEWVTLNMTSGLIEAPGASAYGIYTQDSDEFKVNITGGTITSGNVAIQLANGRNTTKYLNIYGGTIHGENYGIYQTRECAVTIGDPAATVTNTNPVIEGVLYGYYKSTGTSSINSGVIKGTTSAYYGTFNNIRENYELLENTSALPEYLEYLRSISTTNHSTEAVSLSAKDGDGYAKITYTNQSDIGVVTNIDDINNSLFSAYKVTNIKFTGKEKMITIEHTGPYILEVWGAQGGTPTNSAFGGYSKGTVNLEAGQRIYVNVGGQGAQYDGGYNGGGTGGAGGGQWSYGGGGATHIATRSGVLSQLADNQNTVLIVAGGGGGNGGSDGRVNAGSGGGYSGSSGYDTHNQTYTAYNGTGATQSGGGTSYNCSGGNGSFGQGGNFCNSGYGGAGGGGGWYGGGGSNRGHGGGGGGSGYIGNSKLTDKHMACYNCTVSDEVSSKTISVTNYDQEAKEDFAKVGDGYARITFIGEDDSESDIYTVTLSTNIGTIENTTLTYNANSILGNIPAPVVTDDNLVFDGWYLDSGYTKKVSSSTRVNHDAVLHARFVYGSEYCSLQTNRVYEFPYTGGEQVFNATCPGTYKIELWGAGGGKPFNGYGAYTVGEIELVNNEKIYINVGGAGGSASGSTGGSAGYNGGGKGGNGVSYAGGTGGGGATHIATRSGTLVSLKDYKEDVIMVAAGGGGSPGAGWGDLTGGSGGGYQGAAGQIYNNSTSVSSTGGTQTSGYAFGQGSAGSNGYAGGSYSAEGDGGSGGGWYGGKTNQSKSGNNQEVAGAGGSSYVGYSRLSNTYMYGYNIPEKYVNGSSVVYLIPITDKVKNTTTDTLYKNIQTAFEDALDGDVIELIGDATISTELTLGNKEVTLDLHGYELNTNKTINNNGTLTITDLTNSGTSKIINNISSTMIINNKNLNISNISIKGAEGINNKSAGIATINNINIDSSSNGISNSGTLNINNIYIKATNYAIYDSGAGVSTIKNANLNATTAVYINSSAKVSFTGTYKSTGTINVNGSSSQLIINPSTGATITGEIINRGKTNIYNTSISYTVSAHNSYAYIDNYGELLLDQDTITLHNTNNSYDSAWDSDLRNNGTLRTSNTTFNYSHDYKNKDVYVILNYSLWYSQNDTINGSGSNRLMGIDNTTNNSAEIRNITIKLTDTNSGYGIYNDKGTLGVSGGIITSDGTNNYGLHMVKGTVALENVDIDVSGTGTNKAIYHNTGTLNIISGNYFATGSTAIGIDVNTDGAILNLGVEGSPVSATNPYIKATGTTSGIGISQGEGTFNYFDGKIAGTTGYKATGDITSYVEENYNIVEDTFTEDEKEYKLCYLEIIF